MIASKEAAMVDGDGPNIGRKVTRDYLAHMDKIAAARGFEFDNESRRDVTDLISVLNIEECVPELVTVFAAHFASRGVRDAVRDAEKISFGLSETFQYHSEHYARAFADMSRKLSKAIVEKAQEVIADACAHAHNIGEKSEAHASRIASATELSAAAAASRIEEAAGRVRETLARVEERLAAIERAATERDAKFDQAIGRFCAAIVKETGDKASAGINGAIDNSVSKIDKAVTGLQEAAKVASAVATPFLLIGGLFLAGAVLGVVGSIVFRIGY
jgi:hypothetical protein